MQNNDEHGQSVRDMKGFDPSRPATEFFGCFTKQAAMESLFGSTRSTPIPVFLTDDEAGVRIPVVIDLARPLYDPRLIGYDQEHPDWYFEGWVVPSGFVPGATIQRIRIMVSTLEDEFNEGDFFQWQYILDNEPSQDGTLSWSFH